MGHGKEPGNEHVTKVTTSVSSFTWIGTVPCLLWALLFCCTGAHLQVCLLTKVYLLLSSGNRCKFTALEKCVWSCGHVCLHDRSLGVCLCVCGRGGFGKNDSAFPALIRSYVLCQLMHWSGCCLLCACVCCEYIGVNIKGRKRWTLADK